MEQAQEATPKYGLYKADSKVYACDETGKQTEPAAEIDKNTVTDLFVAEGVKIIRVWAFSYCKNLKNATLPAMVTEIGSGAFKDSGLTGIELPEGLTKLGSSAFENCADLKEIKIPVSLTNWEPAPTPPKP